MKKILSSPCFAALVGGAIVAAAMLIAGIGNTTNRTIVEPASLSAESGASPSGQLTPGEIYKRDAPGVVYITATVVQQTYSPFDLFPSTTRGTDTGSGFVINSDGVILTNAHVISGAVKITVSFANNQSASAKVIGRDPDDDLALLRVRAPAVDPGTEQLLDQQRHPDRRPDQPGQLRRPADQRPGQGDRHQLTD